MMLEVELSLKYASKCFVKIEYLNDFVNAVQNGGFYVVITTTDGDCVDVENDELYDDEYCVTVFKAVQE